MKSGSTRRRPNNECGIQQRVHTTLPVASWAATHRRDLRAEQVQSVSAFAPNKILYWAELLPTNASTAERINFFHHVPELAFVDSNIHDDARQGIATLSAMEAKSTIMQSMLSELRILFGLNVAVSVIVRLVGCRRVVEINAMER